MVWGISAQTDKIITHIQMQKYEVNRWGMEPNRVILGRRIYDTLDREFNYGVRCSMIEHYANDNAEYVVGLPITIDERNRWLIKVCYGFETDGKELLYPDKIDPEENG